LSEIEKLIPDNQVICQSGKPHAFIRVAHAFLEGIAVVHSGGNDAALKKNWHTATHQILAWAPLPPGGLQNSAGVAAFWLGWPVRTNNGELRAVRHTELAHDLPHMNFFPHPQPARNGLVRVASTQEFEDRALPRC
jgi:hypothetical protein